MVRVRMIKANDIFSVLASFTLDADEFLGIDLVAVVWRVIASVSGTREASYGFGTVVCKSAEQHAAAFVRIGFFAVQAERIVNAAGDSEHLVIAEARGQIAE